VGRPNPTALLADVEGRLKTVPHAGTGTASMGRAHPNQHFLPRHVVRLKSILCTCGKHGEQACGLAVTARLKQVVYHSAATAVLRQGGGDCDMTAIARCCWRAARRAVSAQMATSSSL